MADDKQSHSLGDLIIAATSGLPAALSKSALGALNRLVSGVADIPATYLAGWKERIEDHNYERRVFRRGLVDAAASKASVDTELVDRTIQRLLNEQVKKQANREAIAVEAAGLLTGAVSEKAEEPKPIDEDWLNSFEKFAEDASSERMRTLWARVLSGEILKSGSFGLRTLRFLHELDTPTAQAFEEVSKHVLNRHVFAGSEPESSLFGKMLHLEALGVVSGAAGIIHYQARTDEAGRFAIPGARLILVGLSEPSSVVLIDATPLTKVGQEILKIVPNQDEERTITALSEQLKTPNPLSPVPVKGIDIAEKAGATVKLVKHLWGDSAFS